MALKKIYCIYLMFTSNKITLKNIRNTPFITYALNFVIFDKLHFNIKHTFILNCNNMRFTYYCKILYY